MSDVLAATDELLAQATAARDAASRLQRTTSEERTHAVQSIARALQRAEREILEANERDCERLRGASGRNHTLIDRLLLNGSRLRSMVHDVEHVAALPDPIGEEFDLSVRPNGLRVSRVRVPLGVIGVIYEARPNVTSDVVALCIKTANAVVLRGGSSASESNDAIVRALKRGLAEAGLPSDAVQFITSPDRHVVERMLRLRGYIDVIIPRGGVDLIKFAVENATVPVIETGAGVCHTYVDDAADPDVALRVAYNAKVRRPTICNALDTLLVHHAVAVTWLPRMAAAWLEAGVEMRADPAAAHVLGAAGIDHQAAEADDWGREFLSMTAAVKIVDGLDEALAHIRRYGSGHSEAIITTDEVAARRFLNEVDAAAVYVNASTQFTDGGEFGLGAEIGISTQKVHARGPMGLKELTTYKWVVLGSGQVRP
jgi:glutamate-5-semialdehyde dehydrogenase